MLNANNGLDPANARSFGGGGFNAAQNQQGANNFPFGGNISGMQYNMQNALPGRSMAMQGMQTSTSQQQVAAQNRFAAGSNLPGNLQQLSHNMQGPGGLPLRGGVTQQGMPLSQLNNNNMNGASNLSSAAAAAAAAAAVAANRRDNLVGPGLGGMGPGAALGGVPGRVPGNMGVPGGNPGQFQGNNTPGPAGEDGEQSVIDMSEFPSLSARNNAGANAGGGMHGVGLGGLGPGVEELSLGPEHYGAIAMQKANQPHSEFSIQNEDFPALPGLGAGGGKKGGDQARPEMSEGQDALGMQSQQFQLQRQGGGFHSGGLGGFGQGVTGMQQQVSVNGPPSTSGGLDNMQQLQAGLNQEGRNHFGDNFSGYQHGRGNMGGLQGGLPGMGGAGGAGTNMPGMGGIGGLAGPHIRLGPRPGAGGGYEHLSYIQQQQQSMQGNSGVAAAAQQQAMRAGGAAAGMGAKGGAGMKKMTPPDRFGLLGLLSVIRMQDPDLTTLALGTDLTTLGLNLNSPGSLYKTFASPWADSPGRVEPDFNLPSCYLQPLRLQPGYFGKYQDETLLYIFYSMPNDEAQLFAADELHNRGWLYHKILKVWLTSVPNSEPSVKNNHSERGSFYFFDTNTWERVRKDNFVLQYDQLEARVPLKHGAHQQPPQHPQQQQAQQQQQQQQQQIHDHQ